ncbi:MAG: hypothetical protein ACK56I_13410 [bacterium]
MQHDPDFHCTASDLHTARNMLVRHFAVEIHPHATPLQQTHIVGLSTALDRTPFVDVHTPAAQIDKNLGVC